MIPLGLAGMFVSEFAKRKRKVFKFRVADAGKDRQFGSVPLPPPGRRMSTSSGMIRPVEIDTLRRDPVARIRRVSPGRHAW
jgi:hypothetical protein